jgi:hypothetical protein
LTSEFSRRDVREFEGRVRVEEGDKVRSGVATSSDESYALGGSGVRSRRREGSGRGGDGGGGRFDGGTTSRSGEGSEGGSDVARRLNGTAGRGSVGDGEEGSFDTVVLLELLDEAFDFSSILNSVVEEGSTVASEGTVGALKVPRLVLVVGLGSPEESLEVLLDRVENVVGDSVLDRGRVGEEFGHNGDLSFGVRNDCDDIARFVSVDCVGSLRLLEFSENLSDALASRSDVLVSFGENSSETVLSDSFDRVVLVELVSASEESSSSRVGEEFLLKVVGGDDRDGRRAGKVVQEFLDFAKLEFGTVFYPFLFHEVVVFLNESSDFVFSKCTEDDWIRSRTSPRRG